MHYQRLGFVRPLCHDARLMQHGLTHSALVTLDGGSADCPTMGVLDSDGRSLGEALHEEWPYCAGLE